MEELLIIKTCKHQNVEILQGQKHYFKNGYLNWSGDPKEDGLIGKSYEKVQCADCKEILEVSAF